MSDSVDENTAIKKYKDFLANLSQSKLGRFFEANKDREWFRLKYHPVESQKALHQQNVNFMKRLKIFNELHERKYFDSLHYNATNVPAIIDLMDAIIVQLDDGPEKLSEQLLAHIQVDPEQRQKYVPNRPTSVVINDISVETTFAEIQEVCTSAHPDLLRIAQLDPYYIEEGNLRRKVIAVYASHVNIRDVCWKLSRVKLNNRVLSVSINKCLTNRVHKIDAISNHHICVVNDIRNAIILILNFDGQRGLYGKRKQLLETVNQAASDNRMDFKDENPLQESNSDSLNNVAPLSPPGSEKSGNEEDENKPFDINSLDEEKEKEKRKLLEFKFNIEPSCHRQVSKIKKYKNPVLEGSWMYIVEFIESSTALYYLNKVPTELHNDEIREELATTHQDRMAIISMILKNLQCSLEESTRFLDRLLWYLRIVHSFDYYNKCTYKQEDELTLKMGVVHVRDDPSLLPQTVDLNAIDGYIQKTSLEFEEFGQMQKYVTKDEERYNYKSYGKVITDELTSYTQKIQKPKSSDMEEVYKCRHCVRQYQKLSDIGRHFVSKHKWAIDTIEVETDFFNAYLFDSTKMDPCPPKELLELPPNRFARMANFSQMGEDPDLLQKTIEAYSKMDDFVIKPAPRIADETNDDPRNKSIVDYTDISFDDAI